MTEFKADHSAFVSLDFSFAAFSNSSCFLIILPNKYRPTGTKTAKTKGDKEIRVSNFLFFMFNPLKENSIIT